MRIEVLGSFGGESMNCRMTCLLINDTIALDAGSLSQALPIERQRKIHTILLTHSHMDHTSSLPFFVGLAVVMPVLGHSTWHLYRRVVER